MAHVLSALTGAAQPAAASSPTLWLAQNGAGGGPPAAESVPRLDFLPDPATGADVLVGVPAGLLLAIMITLVLRRRPSRRRTRSGEDSFAGSDDDPAGVGGPVAEYRVLGVLPPALQGGEGGRA